MHWNHEAAFDQRTPMFSPPRSLSDQPMARYLQEPDRTLFTHSHFEEDVTMHPFPSVPAGALTYHDSESSLYSLQQRLPSPSNSGLSSSHISSNWSDRDRTPWSSPEMSAGAYSPEGRYIDHAVYSLGGHDGHDANKSHSLGHCVALHEVQQYADAQPEKVAFDDEHVAYGSYAQEGYQPMQPNGNVQHETPVVPSQRDADEVSNGHHGDEAAPVLRRRRAQSTRSITSPYLPSKVSKRPGTGKRSSSYQGKANDRPNGGGHCTVSKSFPCPFATYGCVSTFGSKNEWKRHVNTQHMRLGYWRCDQCPQVERKPNDFNRKDLFTQHVRRMHPIEVDTKVTKKKTIASSKGRKDDAEEQALADTSRRCYRKLRAPPAKSGCLFCDVAFNGPNSWEERMEHVGRHMEAAKKVTEQAVQPNDWQVDGAAEEWLIAEGLVVKSRGHLTLADLK